MGYADGGGDTVNVWRQVSHMEAILQALTYPEIGSIVFRDANFNAGPGGPRQRHEVPDPERRRLHHRVPGPGDRTRRTRSSKPRPPGSRTSRSRRAGSDCPDRKARSFPARTTRRWSARTCARSVRASPRCSTRRRHRRGRACSAARRATRSASGGSSAPTAALADGVDLINPPANENSTTGDTYWVNDDGPRGGSRLAHDEPRHQGMGVRVLRRAVHGPAGVRRARHPGGGPHDRVADRRADAVLRLGRACTSPTYNIWYSAGGNFQSRVAVTAAMLSLQGAEVPGEVVVPHVMRRGHRRRLRPRPGERGRVGDVARPGRRARRDVRAVEPKRSRRRVDGPRTWCSNCRACPDSSVRFGR